jgi:hypothetical protein
MDYLPLLKYGILAILIILAIVLYLKIRWMRKTGRKIEPNYRAMFYLGFPLIGTGVALAVATENPGMYGMTALGVIYLIMGITHRDQWQNNHH